MLQTDERTNNNTALYSKVRRTVKMVLFNAAIMYPSAAVNGHPTNAPSAVKKTAPGMLPIYQHPMAIVVVFMAKELGRNAVEDVNMPVAKMRVARVSRPVFTPN